MPNGDVGTFRRGRIKLRKENTDEAIANTEIWVSDRYEVSLKKGKAHGFGDNLDVWHLLISSVNHEPVHDWRDLQQIKNLLCGPESEAIELYPAESRLVDTRNQYHLWVFMDKKMSGYVRLPIGFDERNVVDLNPNGLKQRENDTQESTHNVEDKRPAAK